MIIHRDGHQIEINLLTPGTVHKFSPSAGSAANSSAIGKRIVRIVSTAAVNIVFGVTSPTAAATDSLLPANTVEYFDMGSNLYVAAYGTADVYVTEMSL